MNRPLVTYICRNRQRGQRLWLEPFYLSAKHAATTVRYRERERESMRVQKESKRKREWERNSEWKCEENKRWQNETEREREFENKRKRKLHERAWERKKERDRDRMIKTLTLKYWWGVDEMLLFFCGKFLSKKILLDKKKFPEFYLVPFFTPPSHFSDQ